MFEHILFATDFSDGSQVAENRAVEMAQNCNAKLSVIHVIDYFPSMPMESSALYSDLDNSMRKKIEAQMAECRERVPVELGHAHIGQGTAKYVITDYAEEIGADLIVLGSHGGNGFRFLLGSTANGVLHVAKCDVMAVRLQDA